jgi:hypothetical protein
LRNHKVTWWVPRACPPGTSPRNAPGGPPPRFPTPLRSGGAICMDIYLSLHGPCCQWCSPLHSRIYISCSRGRLRPRTNWPICPPMPINAHRAPGRTSPAPPPPSAPSQPANQPAIAPRPPNHARQYTPGHRAGVRTPSGPRASCLARPSPPQLSTGPPAGAANSPAAPTGAPCPPSLGHEAPPAAPSPRDWGTEDRLWRVVAWAAGCRGVLPRGSPCQGPHRKIPRRPGTHTTQRSQGHGSSIPQPRTVGPRSLLHKLTDPIWGVKIQNAVKVARNCCGGQFLYGGGPCTTKTPYKVGHLFEKLSDILGT